MPDPHEYSVKAEDERQLSTLFVVTPETVVFSETVPRVVILTPPSVSVQKAIGLIIAGVDVGGITVAVGTVVGVAVGVFVGLNVGIRVGVAVGILVGVAVGINVGVFVGGGSGSTTTGAGIHSPFWQTVNPQSTIVLPITPDVPPSQ